MTTQVTTGLTQLMQTYYEKSFLERARDMRVFEQGAQMRRHPSNSGKSVRFSRLTQLAKVTSALTEGSNPADVDLTAVNVDATLAEYGSKVTLSRFLTLTDIDQQNKEKIDLLGQNMGESLDELVRDELFTGATARLANGVAALTDIATSDILDADEVRAVVAQLKVNKALPFSGRFPWLGKASPQTTYDLMGDTTWENAKVYSDVDDLYRGEVGAIHGARIIESTNPKTEASTVTVYSNFFHGRDAFGVIDLEGDPVKLHIVDHTKIDSNNPAGRFGVASWAGSYVCKTLNSDWLINVKTGTQYS